MARTYLQLVNDVLTRLRETQVTTVAASPYSLLVGALVNDAKREVEDSWQWLALQDYMSYSTTQGTYVYETNSINTNRTAATATDRTRLWIDPFIDKPIHLITTPNYERNLEYEPSLEDQQGKQIIVNQNQQDVPISYQITQSSQTVAGQWNKQIRLYAIPNQVYTLSLYLVNPQNDLSNDTDVLLVPYAPVVQKAYLYALYERGEELGETLDRAEKKDADTLTNAIAFDQQLGAQYQQFAIPYGAHY